MDGQYLLHPLWFVFLVMGDTGRHTIASESNVIILVSGFEQFSIESSQDFIGFAVPRPVIGLMKLAPTSPPIRCRTNTQTRLGTPVFPPFCVFLLWILIGFLWYFSSRWLVVAIALSSVVQRPKSTEQSTAVALLFVK